MMDVVLMLLVVGLPAGGSNSSSSRRGKQQQIHKHGQVNVCCGVKTKADAIVRDKLKLKTEKG
jgi:hypothetical protein